MKLPIDEYDRITQQSRRTPQIFRQVYPILLLILASILILTNLNQSNQKEYGTTIIPSKPNPENQKGQNNIKPYTNYKPVTKNLLATTEHSCRGEWSPSKEKYYSDRISNSKKLILGEFICSTNGLYKFGLDTNGDLVWIDTSQKEERKTVYFKYDKDTSNINPEDYYFALRKDGRFVVYNDSEEKENEIWIRECERDVSYTYLCLRAHDIDYSCPYLHIHEGGKVVLNYIDHDWNWIARDIVRVYGFEE